MLDALLLGCFVALLMCGGLVTGGCCCVAWLMCGGMVPGGWVAW